MSEYGPRLYDLVERQWLTEGASQNAWTLRNGLPNYTVDRWSRKSKGSEPTFEYIRKVADVLGMPVLAVLVEIGYITPEEAGIKVVTRPEPDVIKAIAHSKAHSIVKTALLGMARAIANDASKPVTGA